MVDISKIKSKQIFIEKNKRDKISAIGGKSAVCLAVSRALSPHIYKKEP